MKLELVGKQSDLLFDPVRVWRGMGRDKSVAENLGRGISGIIDFAVETPCSIVENLLWRIPVSLAQKNAFQKPVVYGHVDLPDELKAENLFNSVRGESPDEGSWIKMRQPWVDQYSDKFRPYRLDINLTPLLQNTDNEKPLNAFRIMEFSLIFRIEPPFFATDVFPQTLWEKEGLQVGDHVALDIVGKYKPMSKIAARRVNVGPLGADVRAEVGADVDATAQRHYFYKIDYAPEVAIIEGRALSDGFGWRYVGTYERYVECGTKRLTAILAVPRDLIKASVSVEVICGITDRDRRDPSYPANGSLLRAEGTVKGIPVVFAQ